ncbi:MAG: AMP-dependent synthetase, partial [Pedosphaera sp.]|nr:AMP-dependent synthetase [Pedosphaera sp.]
RERPKQLILEDALRHPLTYRRLLVAADVLSHPLEKALAANQPRVGVLLPNTTALPVLLLSLWRFGKVPAILNFSTGAATMLACSQLAGLKQIVTSRAFLERARLKLEPLTEAGIKFIYLEDLRPQITSAQKFFSLVRMTLNPGSLTRNPQTSPSPSPNPQSAIRNRPSFSSPAVPKASPKASNSRTQICSRTCARCSP